MHAALLHEGKVLFITADETTLLWDPANATPSSFEDPTNQPHTMPGGYSQLCGTTSSFPTARCYRSAAAATGPTRSRAGATSLPPHQDPDADDMSESKWYPTAVALGDRRVLVACGNTAGDMDIYDEAADTFAPVTAGDTRRFPNLYPGPHCCPTNPLLADRLGKRRRRRRRHTRQPVRLLHPQRARRMVAGWNNTTIELFDPPYLSKGLRSTIAIAPALVHHGASFRIELRGAAVIVKVVLVRPMAVTHQTDSEQRVLELPYVHDPATRPAWA